jgi:hypothetical protein
MDWEDFADRGLVDSCGLYRLDVGSIAIPRKPGVQKIHQINPV